MGIFFSILEPRHLPLDTIQTHIPFLCTILLSPQTINSHDGPLDIKTTPPQQTATPPPASTNHKQHRQHELGEKNRKGARRGDREANIHTWNIIMDGPEGSPYAGGKFHLLLTLPHE